jgi:hypothetical protein
MRQRRYFGISITGWPRERHMPRNDELTAEIRRIRKILATIHDPYDRYQLTLLLETAARVFVSPGMTKQAEKTGKGKRQCKTVHNTLPN